MEQDEILIVEDDIDILEILSLYLKREQFNVYTATNGKEALEIINKQNIKIALIDIMMPIMNGYELIKEIRKINNIPIIIISAKNMEEDKIFGLEIGADAYITKPFSPAEVVATIKAILRRCYKYEELRNQNKNKIIVGDLEFDEEDYVLRKNGEKINLTNTELKILVKMMREPGKLFTREQLYECIDSEYLDTDANTMMVHISNIRSKIKDDQSYIKTIRGVGYKIEKK